MVTLAKTGNSFLLTDDAALASVLSDIPYFCVGLMAFGIFTFFLFMSRLTLPVVYLSTSALFVFTAAILDLSQILTGGSDTAQNLSAVSFTGFSIGREIFLSLSLGFLFLFLWKLVSQCPDGESTAHPTDPRAPSPALKHVAEWQQWGVFGMVLQWATLTASISIPLLQILWRMVPGQHVYGNLYIAESTIETVTSTTFILKILLNIYLTETVSRWRCFLGYLVPITSLLLSAGIGVGNVVTFTFSETILGRLLRAIEIYLLILHLLITTFYRTNAFQDRREVQADIFPSPAQRFLEMKSKEEGSNTAANVARTSFYRNPMLVSQSKPSTFSLVIERFSQGPRTSKDASWLRESKIEPRPTLYALSPKAPRRSTGSFSQNSTSPPVSERPTPTSNDRNNGKADIEALTLDRPFTEMSFSYYAMEPPSFSSPPKSSLALPNNQRSSIRSNDTSEPAGLTGSPIQPVENSTRPASQSVSSFDELLRQQTELDRSIAALRLFSSRSIGARASLEPTYDIVSQSNSERIATGVLGQQKPESASGRSEFSLSHFPEPPKVPEASIPSMSRFSNANGRDESSTLELPTTDSNAQTLTASEALTAPVVESARPNSGGTQYDVTSFIGDLSHPKTTTVSSFKNTSVSAVESEDNITSRGTADQSGPSLRAMILPSVVSRLPIPAAETASVARSDNLQDKSESQSPSLTRDSNTVMLRPFYLGTSSTAVPTTLPSSTMVPIGSRKPKLGGAGWRPKISAPRSVPEESRTDELSDAFERPRPPPLRLGPPQKQNVVVEPENRRV